MASSGMVEAALESYACKMTNFCCCQCASTISCVVSGQVASWQSNYLSAANSVSIFPVGWLPHLRGRHEQLRQEGAHWVCWNGTRCGGALRRYFVPELSSCQARIRIGNVSAPWERSVSALEALSDVQQLCTAKVSVRPDDHDARLCRCKLHGNLQPRARHRIKSREIQQSRELVPMKLNVFRSTGTPM